MPDLTKPKHIRPYGWLPDRPDERDFLLREHPKFGAVRQPLILDLRQTPFSPPVYDQGQMGSCVGNSTARMFRFMHRKLGLGDLDPARMFIYNEARIKENSLGSDSGAMIADALAVLGKIGVCEESKFPYTTRNLYKKPGTAALTAAKKHLAITRWRINNLNEMLQCLADGFPCVFGFTVYSSFESDKVARTGVMPMPQKGDSNVGGHAIEVEGYNKNVKRLLIANSWGTVWGQKGFFEMPFDYVDAKQNLWDDAWTIRTES
jgi:C1A family cysteine protease